MHTIAGVGVALIPITKSNDPICPFPCRINKQRSSLRLVPSQGYRILVSSKAIYVVNCIKYNTPFQFSNSSMRLPHRHRPIRHTKVRRNRPLPTNTTGSSGLGSRQTRENAHLQHTSNGLDPLRQLVHLPETVLAGSLAGCDIGLGEQRREGSVDEEKVLIGLEGTFLGICVGADGRVYGAEFLQFADDAVGGDGGDFDGDVFPACEEAGLEFARVWRL